MHDLGFKKFETEGRVLKLSGRDVEDAKRLLSLLATNQERILIEPAPRTAGISADKEVLLSRAKQLIANRRRRHAIFGKAMFGEPAWDMLLLLYVFDRGSRQSVGRIAEMAAASKTTGGRWIEYLEKQQLVGRSDHPTDKRTAFLQLTSKGRDAIELYLSDTLNAVA